jgi:hypothetical protein
VRITGSTKAAGTAHIARPGIKSKMPAKTLAAAKKPSAAGGGLKSARA